MADFSKQARKITFVLFIAQSLYSTGNIASVTVTSILSAKLGGSDYWTGVPTAVFLLGTAFAASAWGYIMERFGRRNGLVLGLLIGLVGNGLVLYAITTSSLMIVLLGTALLGAPNAAITLSRFVAGEVNPPEKRGSAISLVVWGRTFGAVFGPMLVAPAGLFVMKSFGLDELAGAYFATFILFALLTVILFVGLRPDPGELGEQIAEMYPSETSTGESRTFKEILQEPAARMAVIAMVLGQVVMMAIMSITSQHMTHYHHMLGDIASVIQAHTIGMYAFAVVSGYLSDKWGRGPVILVGSLMLMLACVTAPISPDVLPLSVSLFLLGLGWNFCFVGGSALLSDHLSPVERSHTQGTNDLLVGLAAATGSLGSGFVFAATSYTLIAFVAGGLSLIPLVMSITWMRMQKVAVVA